MSMEVVVLHVSASNMPRFSLINSPDAEQNL
jgi:hypothetical protein